MRHVWPKSAGRCGLEVRAGLGALKRSRWQSAVGHGEGVVWAECLDVARVAIGYTEVWARK